MGGQGTAANEVDRRRAAGRGARRCGRPRRRHGTAIFCVVAVLASLVALPVVGTVTTTAAGAAGIEVPSCGPEVGPFTANNCLAEDLLPGTSRPDGPSVGAPRPYGDGRTALPITVTAARVGAICPGDPIPAGALPCTRSGIAVTTWVYQPGRDLPGDARNYGIEVRQDQSDGTPSNWCAFTNNATCTVLAVYDPAAVVGTVPLIFGVGTTVVGAGGVSQSIGYEFTTSVTGSATSDPTASFELRGGIGSQDDPMTFLATSTDPTGSPLLHRWDFGDDQSAEGEFVTHAYARPGDYTVTLTSTNLSGRSATTTRIVEVAAPELGLSIDLLDGVAPPLEPGASVAARVTVSASSDGVGAIQGIRFADDALLKVDPGDAFLITDGPTPPVPPGGFDLAAGEQATFDVRIEPQIVGRYTISSQVTGTDGGGTRQTAEASSPGEIGSALAVAITLDPPFADQVEGPNGPEPVDVTATVSFTNTTGVAMDAVVLTSLRVDRTAAGQLLAVTQTGGADPGDDGLAIGALAPGETKQVTATFRATDDAEVEFSALATAHLADGRDEIGAARQRWSVRPDKLLRVRTEVTNPPNDSMLPAGELVRISGTVKNLSNTATIEVGPLYPTLAGNAGAMSFAWSTAGTDPKDMVPTGNTTLGPGESRSFSVRFLTTWSDPRAADESGRPTGGTQATATFTPWGVASLEDGTTVDVTPARLDAGDADLSHRVSIDDSITIPSFDPVAFGGAIMYGAAEGIWGGTAAVIMSVYDLVKLPYTVVAGTAAMQQQVWDSFTDEERDAFANDTALMAAAVLARNAEYGKQGAEKLYQLAKDTTLRSMTEMANTWEVGDYTDTTRLWTSYGANALTQVVVPVALGKLAKSPAAVRALARAQEAIQTRMGPVLSRTLTAQRLEELGPILNALESGTELLPEQLATLYGITPEELTELQKLADQFDLLLTVRSRHASSISWIERFDAMLKPEALKIKTVSEYDVALLGYKESDIGSLVFRKPEVLRAFDAGEGDLGELVNRFLTSKGYEPGTVEWQNALNRTMLRAGEWRKWEKYYKRWDAQGWIDVSLNYEGNAITDPIKKGRSGLGVAPLESGKYVGFRLNPTGADEYVLEMMNNKVGRFVPITGDIDPIAFTHLDGSPLTMAEHAALLDALAKNPLLQAQHGESATFTKGGVDFIQSQFKPNEPGLQIAPGGHLPRVVRLDTDPGRSVWNSPFDYHLRWKGGFVYSGSYVPKGAIPAPSLVVPPITEPLPTRVRAVPKAVTAEPNFGRCRITFSTAVDATSAVMDVNGKVKALGNDGKGFVDSPLHQDCFSPGPPIERSVKPVTGLSESAPVGATEIEIPEGDPWLASAGDGLQVGDVVTIGAGTPDAETHTIVAFGSIIIDAPLEHAHEAGELIVVTSRSDVPPTTTPTTAPPTTTPPPTSPPATAPPVTAPPTTAPSTSATPVPAVVSGAQAGSDPSPGSGSGSGSTSGQDLALTGGEGLRTAALALALVTLGLLFVGWSPVAGRRHRRGGRPTR